MEELEQLARKFRADIGLNSREPLNAKTLLRKCNITAVYRPLSQDSFYGLSMVSADKRYRFMLINSNSTRGRQHYTIGHELYHLYFDEDPRPHLCGAVKSRNERNADGFAAALLMPADGIYEAIPKSEISHGSAISLATVLQLQQLFGVSHQAMLLRLKRLKLITENQLQTMLDVNIHDVARQYGLDASLYDTGNEGVMISDYGILAHELFDQEKISEGHYRELMNAIAYGKD